jgi:hypothetical protein
MLADLLAIVAILLTIYFCTPFTGMNSVRRLDQE